MKEYTQQQLSLRNGQERDRIWVAYKGIIYDLSESDRWIDGKHYEHWAGQDLTHELKNAPHENWVFKRFKKIGYLLLKNCKLDFIFNSMRSYKEWEVFYGSHA